MLKALAEGETDPAALASLADHRLRASQEQLQYALGACKQLHGVYRRLLTMALEELQLIERQMEQTRPGDQRASRSTRSPKGNRNMRRLLNQAAHAAVKMKGSLFQLVFKRLNLKPRLGYKSAIWAIAHRLCR